MMKVEHDEERGRFSVRVGDDEAELMYTLPGPGIMDIQHTFVPESGRGHGIADLLAEAAFAWAREKRYRVVPTCPFVRTWLATHPEEAKLVDSRYAKIIGGRTRT
jgi:predicted GNAT family acetyltransferase